jgi:hypothetical protein
LIVYGPLKTLTIREEQRLRVVGKKVGRKIFVPNEGKGTGLSRKLYNENRPHSVSIGQLHEEKVRRVEHVVCIREMRSPQLLSKVCKERDHLGNGDVDGGNVELKGTG